MMSRGLVALTGGTGFVGGYIVHTLIAAGWRVRLLARRPVSSDLDVECVQGDLADEDALGRLVAGADVLVHAAGLIKAARKADFFRVNEAGSQALAAAWSRHNPTGRVVMVSSLAARAPQLSDYAASKRAGEAAFSGLNAVILRPGAVYGPGDKETAVFFRAARQGLLAMPLSQGSVTLVHAADVASAVKVFCDDTAPNGCFALTDGHPDGYGWGFLATALGAAVGQKVYVVAVPQGVMAGLAVLGGLWSRLSGKPAMLTPGKVRELFYDWACTPD
ncbi:MAG: SDR family NAD(P)-dependent oxidoreductase, partial [Rhizomicrobium sp.]